MSGIVITTPPLPPGVPYLPLHRLATFEPVVKQLHQVFILELSQHGLFWNNSLQRICCVYCNYIGNISRDPLQDHTRISSMCKGVVESRNSALNSSRNGKDATLTNLNLQKVGSDKPASQQSPESFLRGKPRSIGDAKLFDGNFINVSKRRDTFEKLAYVSSETADKFSKAGFMHEQGVLRCFCCGLTVQPYEIEDNVDPWQIHATRTTKNCAFVRVEKGDKYISTVTKSLGDDDIFNDAEVTAMISSTLCGQLINMGFSRKSITIAAHARKKTVGEAFPNMESVIEDALDVSTESADPKTSKTSDTVHKTNADKTDKIDELMTRIDGNSTNKNSDERMSESASGYSPVISTNNIKSNDSQVFLGDKPSLKMEIERISEENESLRDRRLCRICMDAEIDIVFLKCGHYLCCSDCAAAVKLCPVCREVIRGTVRVMAPTKSLKRI